MGRNPASAVLVHLLRHESPWDRMISPIASATGFSESAVRANLGVMVRVHGWVTQSGRPAVYELTERGREVARHRARG